MTTILRPVRCGYCGEEPGRLGVVHIAGCIYFADDGRVRLLLAAQPEPVIDDEQAAVDAQVEAFDLGLRVGMSEERRRWQRTNDARRRRPGHLRVVRSAR